MNAVRGKFGADSMAVAACLVTSLDAILVAKADVGTPHLALCLISSLALAGEMFAAVLYARAMRKSLRVPAIGKRCFAVTGETDSRAVNVTASAAGSKGKAIGLSINANLFRRESTVEIAGGEGYAIKAAKDVLIQAYGNDTTVMAGLAMAGSTDGNTLGGNLPLVSGKNTVTTTLGKGSITAEGEAAISSHLKDRTYVIAGSIAMSNSKNAVGGTALLAFKENTVKTDLGESTVSTSGNNGSLAERVAGSPSFNGLYVGATVDNTTITGAAGVALAGDKGVTANGVVLDSENHIEVDASKARLVNVSSKAVKKAYPFFYGRKIGFKESSERIPISEDRAKTEQYRANAMRQAEQSHFADLESYLYSLDMQLDIIPADEHNLPRIAQMTQKTNQFNLTTKRYTDADVKGFLADGWKIWCISVADRFGDNGITGCIMVRPTPVPSPKVRVLEIDTFLLSCRILGKGI
jgi:hypothetical protein